MKGIILKSHTFPTFGKARVLDRIFPDINVMGSITLNQVTGGIDPVTVELALKMGCKVVHMPTWSSKYDLGNNLAFFLIQENVKSSHELTVEKDGLSIYDETGKVSDKTMKVLELVKEFDACLFTGHMDADESLKTLELCQEMGITKGVFGHPLAQGTSVEKIEKALSFGASVEFTYLCLHTIYSHHPVPQMLKDIKYLVDKYGAERFILCSDHFDDISPLVSEGLREFVTILAKNGISEDDLKTMVTTNQYKLLGM